MMAQWFMIQDLSFMTETESLDVARLQEVNSKTRSDNDHNGLGFRIQDLRFRTKDAKQCAEWEVETDKDEEQEEEEEHQSQQNGEEGY